MKIDVAHLNNPLVGWVAYRRSKKSDRIEREEERESDRRRREAEIDRELVDLDIKIEEECANAYDEDLRLHGGHVGARDHMRVAHEEDLRNDDTEAREDADRVYQNIYGECERLRKKEKTRGIEELYPQEFLTI
jgi:hypothetical protein